MLGGRSEFIEKYGEVISELCARGFDVATFDWRGQGGSSRALANPLYGHVIDFAEFDEDLATFLEQIVKPLTPTAPFVLAHSMGAHIVLRALHDHPSAFRAAVLIAPMIDVYGRRAMRFVLPIINALVPATLPFSRKKESDLLNVPFEQNVVTSDRTRYLRNQSLVRENLSLRLGYPTWGWLRAANASMKLLESNGYAESIKTPVLICAAGKDRLVVTKAAYDLAKRLQRSEYVEIEDAEHEILMENDSIRSRFWQAFDDFLADTLSQECS